MAKQFRERILPKLIKSRIIRIISDRGEVTGMILFRNAVSVCRLYCKNQRIERERPDCRSGAVRVEQRKRKAKIISIVRDSRLAIGY